MGIHQSIGTRTLTAAIVAFVCVAAGSAIGFASTPVLRDHRPDSLPAVALPAVHLDVPFQTQLGSGGVPGSGSENCGPAAAAMVLRYFGVDTTVDAAARAVRGGSNAHGQGGTYWDARFHYDSLFAGGGLSTTAVRTWDEAQGALSDGRPVIVLLNNSAFRPLRPIPYANDTGNWWGAHIVVVVGYDEQNVYINDPLRASGADLGKTYPYDPSSDPVSQAPGHWGVPRDVFFAAVSAVGGWHAMSVGRGTGTTTTPNQPAAPSGPTASPAPSAPAPTPVARPAICAPRLSIVGGMSQRSGQPILT